jgi:dienelactone hydrolase
MKAILAIFLILFFCTGVHGEVIEQSVEYRHGDAVLEGYLAYDDALAGKRPGVLVVHEWWGLNDYAKKRALQLAELGYVAFALDMYGKGVVTDDPKKAGELSGRIKGNPLMRERARAGLEILKEHDLVDRKRIAAIGYCFGGTTVLELAYSGVDIAGVVSFHGGLTTPKPEEIEKIKAALLVLHGAQDPFVPADSMAAFQETMGKSKIDWQMIFYGGAVHSFSNAGVDKFGIKGAAYDARADRRSWRHMRSFFEEIF